MDPSCRWQCGAANTTAVQQTRLAPPEQEAFCNGAGTDMFMQGFQVTQHNTHYKVSTGFHSLSI